MMVNKFSQCLFILLVLVVPASCYEPASPRGAHVIEYLISQKEFFQPFTFNFERNTQEYVGILWVKMLANGTETIVFNYYDGLELSNESTISPYKNNGTYYLPRAITHNSDTFFVWIENASVLTFNVCMRIYYSNNSFGPVLSVASDRCYYNHTTCGPSLSLKLVFYKDDLFIFWVEQDSTLFNKIFFTNTHSFSDIIGIKEKEDYYDPYGLNVGPFDMLGTNDSILLLFNDYFGYGPEGVSYRFFVRYNFSNSYQFNISSNSPDLINMTTISYHTPNFLKQSNTVISYNNRSYINLPTWRFDYYSTPNIKKNWTLGIYDAKNTLENEIQIMNDLTNITKSTIHGYDNKIYVSYFESYGDNQTGLKLLSVDNGIVSEPELLSDSFYCNYSIYRFDAEMQCYLALHTVVAHEMKMLCCLWACQDAECGPFKLKLTKIYTEPYLKCHLVAERTAIQTYENIAFTGQVSSSSEVQFDFDFGDGVQTGWTADCMAGHQYENDGIYLVGLKARTIKGLESDWDYVDITVMNRPPVLSGSVTPDSALTLDPISFSVDKMNDIDGRIVDFRWDFGDGNFSPSPGASHSYSDNGSYTVSFIATDDDGAISRLRFNITVANRPPCIRAAASAYQVLTHDTIEFSSCGTYDMDGLITSLVWDFGDGFNSSMPNPWHNYSVPAIYSVRLEAIDDDGAVNSSELWILVGNRSPIADFDLSASEGTIFTDFSFVPKCSDSDGNITDYHWNFGDGETSNSTSPTHRYALKGDFYIALYVVDDEGAASEPSVKKVTIRNLIPAISIRSSSTDILTLDRIDFKAEASDPDGRIDLYMWNFGDGNSTVGQNASHEYADDGNYTVRLKVIDDDFGENNTNLDITVRNRPPIIDLKYKSGAMTGERIVFDASGSRDMDGRIISIKWLIDDRMTEGIIINHTFEKSGTRIIKAIATDDDGCVTETSFEVRITSAGVNNNGNPWILPLILLVLVIAVFALFMRGVRQK